MLLRQDCSHLYSTCTMIGFVGSGFMSRGAVDNLDSITTKAMAVFSFQETCHSVTYRKGCKPSYERACIEYSSLTLHDSGQHYNHHL